jgi:magnesium chelatase subunit H
MPTLTMINGMERFNAHVWRDVSAILQRDGVSVRIQRFHDGHVHQRDETLARAVTDADVVFISLINDREDADWLRELLKRSRAKAVFAYESMP